MDTVSLVSAFRTVHYGHRSPLVGAGLAPPGVNPGTHPTTRKAIGIHLAEIHIATYSRLPHFRNRPKSLAPMLHNIAHHFVPHNLSAFQSRQEAQQFPNTMLFKLSAASVPCDSRS
jgi:hypothetical protein